MKLLIGLGNPGKQYEKTRHNLGFMAIGQLQKNKADDFLEFKISKKYKAEISEGEIANEKIILARPQTFMNNSGQSVKRLANFYKIKPQDLWVIHDDIDLPTDKIKISRNSSAAGHKGVQSIIDELGTREFVRFRIGIKPDLKRKIPTEKYVLQKIDKKSKLTTDETIKETLTAIEVSLAEGVTEAMNQFN